MDYLKNNEMINTGKGYPTTTGDQEMCIAMAALYTYCSLAEAQD